MRGHARVFPYNPAGVATMKETLERELKLSVDRGFRLPELPGRSLARHTLTSTYHDSRDFRLARAGVTLRRRVENRKSVWQLKLPRGATRRRRSSSCSPPIYAARRSSRSPHCARSARACGSGTTRAPSRT